MSRMCRLWYSPKTLSSAVAISVGEREHAERVGIAGARDPAGVNSEGRVSLLPCIPKEHAAAADTEPVEGVFIMQDGRHVVRKSAKISGPPDVVFAGTLSVTPVEI